MGWGREYLFNPSDIRYGYMLESQSREPESGKNVSHCHIYSYSTSAKQRTKWALYV